MEFGEKLKHAREAKGITQQSLANQLFVTRQAVSRWESGARFPDLLTAKKISERLEVSLDELLSPNETTKCMEENPIIESAVILKIQTALYGFHGMAYLLLLLASLFLWGYSIEDIIQCPSSLLILLPTLLTRILLMSLTFQGLYYSIKEKLSPKKAAIFPLSFCATQIFLSLMTFLYYTFATNTYSFQALFHLHLIHIAFSTFCIISVYCFFFLKKVQWRFGIYGYLTYHVIGEIIRFTQACRASVDTEITVLAALLGLLAELSFAILIFNQTNILYKKRTSGIPEKMC